MAPCFDRVTGKKKSHIMLATDVHENIYLNVTKLRAVTVLPPGPGRTFPGFVADGQQCQPIARGWAVPGRQVQTARCSERVCAGLPGGGAGVCAGAVHVSKQCDCLVPPPPKREGKG